MALKWMKSYLTARYQSVFVDGCLCPPMSIECEVPEDSILTYSTLMISLTWPTNPISSIQPTPYCHDCGGTVCYVDDSTYSLAQSDPDVLSNTLTDQYQVISKYMAANKLVINDDKTHLLVLGTKAMDQNRGMVRMQAGNHTIMPSKKEKLLEHSQ